MNTDLEYAHTLRTTAEWVRNGDYSDKIPHLLDNRCGTAQYGGLFGETPPAWYGPKVRGVPDRFCALGKLKWLNNDDHNAIYSGRLHVLQGHEAGGANLIADKFNMGVRMKSPQLLEECAQILDKIAAHYEAKVQVLENEVAHEMAVNESSQTLGMRVSV